LTEKTTSGAIIRKPKLSQFEFKKGMRVKYISNDNSTLVGRIVDITSKFIVIDLGGRDPFYRIRKDSQNLEPYEGPSPQKKSYLEYHRAVVGSYYQVKFGDTIKQAILINKGKKSASMQTLDGNKYKVPWTLILPPDVFTN
jgi:hypothetical protein